MENRRRRDSGHVLIKHMDINILAEDEHKHIPALHSKSL